MRSLRRRLRETRQLKQRSLFHDGQMRAPFATSKSKTSACILITCPSTLLAWCVVAVTQIYVTMLGKRTGVRHQSAYSALHAQQHSQMRRMVSVTLPNFDSMSTSSRWPMPASWQPCAPAELCLTHPVSYPAFTLPRPISFLILTPSPRTRASLPRVHSSD